jgi:hypothetical protein
MGRSLWNVPMASKVMWSVDNPAYLLMSRMSEVLVEGLGVKLLTSNTNFYRLHQKIGYTAALFENS